MEDIKLVCNSDLLRAGLEQENVLYAQPNTKSMVDCLNFLKPIRPNYFKQDKLGINQLHYMCTKLVWNSGTLCAEVGQENGVYT